MKRLILPLFVIFFFTQFSTAQEMLSRYIMVTDTVEDEGVIFAASSDDAEQENDEIDALFDDDIDAGWEGAPEDQNILTCGMRFRNISIPSGATIDSAFIIVSSHEAKSADDVAELTIYGEATDHAETFTEDALIDVRPSTTATVEWTVAEEWELWGTYQTPDLRTIVQEIIDRDGWMSGNAMAFIVLGKDQGPSDLENAREWEAFENIADPEDGGDGQNHPERVPQLLVYYSSPASMVETRIMVTDTVEDEGVVFAASSDDAEQENDEIDALFDNDIDAGWEGAPEDQNILTAGMRFRNLNIPQGVTIDSAYITVWSHEAKTADDVAELMIYGDAVANAVTFTEDALITDRPSTQNVVAWTVDQEWGLWEPYRTPDLSSIVEEIIANPDWEAGNAMAFVFQGLDQGPSDLENAREWESFENIADPEDGGDGQNHPERVPMLTVHYSNSTTSLKSVQKVALPLKAFPNPVRNNDITVTLENSSPALLRVIDLRGKILLEQALREQQTVILNPRTWAKGSYVVQALQNGKIYSQKVLIQ